MKHLLHIVTAPQPDWVQTLIRNQETQSDVEVEVVDLSTDAQPDYARLLDRILAADCVSTW